MYFRLFLSHVDFLQLLLFAIFRVLFCLVRLLTMILRQNVEDVVLLTFQ